MLDGCELLGSERAPFEACFDVRNMTVQYGGELIKWCIARGGLVMVWEKGLAPKTFWVGLHIPHLSNQAKSPLADNVFLTTSLSSQTSAVVLRDKKVGTTFRGAKLSWGSALESRCN